MSKYIVASSQNIANAPVLQRSALSCREDRRWARDQICTELPQSLPLCHATAAGNPVAALLPLIVSSLGVLGCCLLLSCPPTTWHRCAHSGQHPAHHIHSTKLHTHSLVCTEDGSSPLPLLTQFLISSGSQCMACKPAVSAAPGTL